MTVRLLHESYRGSQHVALNLLLVGITGDFRQPLEGGLKGVVWERVGAELRVVYDRREQLLIADPNGAGEALLELLRDGERTLEQLASTLSAAAPEPIPVEDVRAAVALLDEYGLVEDGVRLGRLSAAEAERHFSNLAFFESFASLRRSREDFRQTLEVAATFQALPDDQPDEVGTLGEEVDVGADASPQRLLDGRLAHARLEHQRIGPQSAHPAGELVHHGGQGGRASPAMDRIALGAP